MQMIKFIIDSAADIEQKEADKLGVTLIPMEIRFGEQEYLDGVTISHAEFFEKLIESAEFPQTSQINEYRWEEQFARLTADGSDVVAITISSKLSGTYSCAMKAAKKFEGKVRVIDSFNASLGERILLEYALNMSEANDATANKIADSIEKQKHRIQVLAVLDTLKFLRKGGRISSVAAFTGELLSIKPVISIIKGEVKLVGKAIGSKKGNNLLMQLVEKCGGIDFDAPYAVAYSGLSDDYLKKYLKDSKSLWSDKTDNVPSYLIGSTIGAHVGPNAIAVAFFAK